MPVSIEISLCLTQPMTPSLALPFIEGTPHLNLPSSGCLQETKLYPLLS